MAITRASCSIQKVMMVLLTSQAELSRPAQLHASQILGYDREYTSILSGIDLFEDLSNFWCSGSNPPIHNPTNQLAAEWYEH